MTELSLEDKLKEKLLEGTTPEEIVEEVVEDVKEPSEEFDKYTIEYLLPIAKLFLTARKREKRTDLIVKETDNLRQEITQFKDFVTNKLDNITQEVENLRFETIENDKKDDDIRSLEERALIKLLDVLDKM